MTDNEILNAIRYSLRKEGVIVTCADECGYYDVNIHEEDAEILIQFVRCLLRELGYTE